MNETRKLQKLKDSEDTIAQQFLLLSIGPEFCLISMQIHMIDNTASSSDFVRISICDRSNKHFFPRDIKKFTVYATALDIYL